MSDTRTLLLVEDEAIVALAEKQFLQREGYGVVHALTGERAVDLIHEGNGIDLVLMDIDLGSGIDGTEAARMILRVRDVPVVFLSSHTEREYTERAEQITSYGYILKHSNPTVLLASIRMAFRLHLANTELRDSNRRLAAFLQISRSLTAAGELSELVQSLVDSATEVMHLDSGAVYLCDSDDTVRLTATCPPTPADFPDEFRHAPLRDHPRVRRAIETATVVVLEDARAATLTPAEREIVELRSLRSNLYVPIRLRDRTLGVLILSSTGGVHSFDDEEVSLLQGFADQAALMIQNALG